MTVLHVSDETVPLEQLVIQDPEPMRKAIEALYFAAHWLPDRPCNARKLWEDLRDAAGIQPGQTAERLGPPQDVNPQLAALVRNFVARHKIGKDECGDLPLGTISAFLDGLCEIVGYYKEQVENSDQPKDNAGA